MNFVNFLACDVLESADANNKLLEVIKIARTCVQIMQVVVPAAVIIWGSLDFFKSVIAGNEKEVQEKRKPFIQRVEQHKNDKEVLPKIENKVQQIDKENPGLLDRVLSRGSL